MSSALEKANILVEALPYIQKFHGKTVVVKYGGHAMVSESLRQAVINDIVLMKLVGMQPVLVHGGGPEINQMLKKLDIKSEFVNGLRVTDAATLEIVEMVLLGKINKTIVNQINQNGGLSVGLDGKDGRLFLAEKQLAKVLDQNGQEAMVDLGFVGDIVKVNTEIVELLLKEGYIPVISPIAVGEDGQSYNVNADEAAAKVAIALKAEKLVLLTDVEGIYGDFNDKSSLISRLTVAEAEALLQKGAIAGGMIPKVKCCLDAVKANVSSTHILDGRKPHSILLEVFTDEGIGTMFVP